jgi:hypothetical protein
MGVLVGNTWGTCEMSLLSDGSYFFGVQSNAISNNRTKPTAAARLHATVSRWMSAFVRITDAGGSSRYVRNVPIVLQKSFYLTDHKFSGP